MVPIDTVKLASAPPQANSKRVRHPQRELIREKIDWWFSSTNLRKDARVLGYINASGVNTPVNVGRFHGRFLVTGLKPKPSVWQIMDAVKDSTVVDIVDKDHVRRKEVYVYESESDDGIWTEEDRKPQVKPPPLHPAIKAGTYKKDSPTGFEADFVDVPTTPKEYEEELELYDSINDFASRIGYAIERFVTRRKFTKDYQKAFGNFLKYGGIYPASHFGQSETRKEIQANEELSKEEKMEMCALYDVDYIDKTDDTKWAVDFEGVAKAYLSTEFAENLYDDNNDTRIDSQCNVLTNFYNYLLHHDVCPEYVHDILAARCISEEARVQLKTIQKLVVQFPTSFSKACSVLFGGDWQQSFGHDTSWGDYSSEEDPHMPKSNARIIVGTALISLAGNALYDAAFPENGATAESTFGRLKYTEKRDVSLEVVGIEPATDETQEYYKSSGLDGKQLKAEPVGRLICKYWRIDNENEWDIPESLRTVDIKDEIYAFWLENDVLASCFVGMKLSASIRKLDVDNNEPSGEGIWVLDSVSRFYCSFFTYLINELCTRKSKEVEWHDEVALMGCHHPEADMARQCLAHMRTKVEEVDADEFENNQEGK